MHVHVHTVLLYLHLSIYMAKPYLSHAPVWELFIVVCLFTTPVLISQFNWRGSLTSCLVIPHSCVD